MRNKEIIECYRQAVKDGAGPITPSCGKLLYILTYSLASKGKIIAVDIGAGHGISTIYIAEAIRDSGGKGIVYTIERSIQNIEKLKQNIRKLNLQDIVQPILGETQTILHELEEADIIFIDTGGTIPREIVEESCRKIKDNGILAIHDTILNINRHPYIYKILDKEGFEHSNIPVDTGVTVASKIKPPREHETILLETYMKSILERTWPISYNTARLLRILAYTLTTREAESTIVDVGSGYGFSTLNIALATKGKSLTYAFEKDHEKIEYLKQVARKMKLQDKIVPIEGDYLEKANTITQKITLIHIDAEKTQYHKYLEKAENKLKNGAIIIAHNTIAPGPHKVERYLKKVYNDKDYTSITTLTDPAGITITLKRRTK